MATEHKVCPPVEESKLRQELKSLEELRIMQLAGISTASVQNTESTIKDRITKDNPYWTVAYDDVCRAVDREMSTRTTLTHYESALKEAKCALVKAAVLLEKNSGHHGESASWNGNEGTNRAAFMIKENEAMIDEISAITKGINL